MPKRVKSTRGRKPTVRTRELARPILRQQRKNKEEDPSNHDLDVEIAIRKRLDERDDIDKELDSK